MLYDSFHNIVGGKKRGSSITYHGIDPTTGDKLWEVPLASHEDLDDAVCAAETAFGPWSKLDYEERRGLCASFGELFHLHSQHFDDLLRKETGKPVRPLLGDSRPRLSEGNRSTMARQWQHTMSTCTMVQSTYAAHLESLTVVKVGLDLPVETIEDDQRIIITEYVPLGTWARSRRQSYGLHSIRRRWHNMSMEL
jgi:hypothetical protein